MSRLRHRIPKRKTDCGNGPELKLFSFEERIGQCEKAGVLHHLRASVQDSIVIEVPFGDFAFNAFRVGKPVQLLKHEGRYT